MSNFEPSREELLQMVNDAHEACRSEAMNCPWCAGQIVINNETHDEFCLWAKMNNFKPNFAND